MGYFCQGTVYGDCCGEGGYCGNTTLFCGAGCQADYGDCWASTLASSVAPVATPLPVQGPFQAGHLKGPLSFVAAATSSSSTRGAAVSPSGALPSTPTDILSIILGQIQACGSSYEPCPNGQCCGSSGQYEYTSPLVGRDNANGISGTGLSYCGASCQFNYGTCWVLQQSGSTSLYVRTAKAPTRPACSPWNEEEKGENSIVM